MATTASDLQTDLAYRLGEQSAATDPTEKARRLSFLNQAYRDVMRRHYWWFTETESTFDSVSGKEYYDSSDGFPSDIRLPLEVRVSGIKYLKASQTDVMDQYNTPYTVLDKSYMIFNNRIYFVPVLTESTTDGISIKYYKKHNPLAEDTDTILIPDEFSDILTSYAEARVSKTDDERGNAADAFDEFNEILNQMTEEHNKYLMALLDDMPELRGLFT